MVCMFDAIELILYQRIQCLQIAFNIVLHIVHTVIKLQFDIII
jgi:hypothetical protein